MNLDRKTAGIGASIAIILVIALFLIYKARSRAGVPSETVAVDQKGEAATKTTPGKAAPRPVVTVTSVGDLEHNGEVRFRFRLDRPATDRIEFPYTYGLKHQFAKLGRDFVIEPEGSLAIENGETETLLVLKRLEPEAPKGPGVRQEQRSEEITLSMLTPRGGELAADLPTKWTFPLEMTEFIAPYRLSVRSPGDFQEPDARKNEQRTVIFELDRFTGETPVKIHYRLDGSALSTDYEVVDPHPNKTLVMTSGDKRAELTLRRLPGARGQGNRKIVVGCVPPTDDSVVIDPDRASVTIGITDPEPQFSWKVAEARNPGTASQPTVSLKATPPVSRTIRIPVQVTSGCVSKRSVCEMKPPADPWSTDETLSNEPVAIPPAELFFSSTGNLKRTVRFEATGDLARQVPPLQIELDDSDPRKLEGHILVVLVLTQNLTREELEKIQAMLDQAEQRGLRKRLVDGTVFVLNANKELSPFHLNFLLESLKDKRLFFRSNAKTAEMFGESSSNVFFSVYKRIQEKKDRDRMKRVILIRDIVNENPTASVQAFSEALSGRDTSIYWFEPRPPQQPSFETELSAGLKARGFKIEITRQGFPAKVLDFLENNVPQR